MAETFHAPLRQRIFNSVLRSLSRVGIPLGPSSLLTVKGRKTGKSYTFPVAPIVRDSRRWLISPYGEVSWVRNARATGEVVLAHGRRRERLGIRELSPEESAPILKDYLTRFALVRPYFDATPQSELAAFVSEASRHPVFQLVEQSG
jgi:deazaflavin-dependent oxidoreductase (nitroreductase family)